MAQCQGIALNDSGAVAGYLFIYYPGQPLFPIPDYDNFVNNNPPGAAFSINNAGVAVGAHTPLGDTSLHPFLYIPGQSDVIDLIGVFGWSSGEATSINNHNDIVGFGVGPEPQPPVFDGYAFLPDRVRINDRGQILGNAVFGEQYKGILYTPGQGVTTLTYQGIGLNNRGQVLEQTPSGSFVVETPGVGVTALPTGFISIAMNDRGEFVGSFQSTNGFAVYYSAQTGIVDLNTVLAPGSGWGITFPYAINNNGQILAQAYQGGRSTSVILTPQ